MSNDHPPPEYTPKPMSTSGRRTATTTTAWPTRAPSSDSLHFTAIHSHAPNHPHILKKRHSNYTLSSSGRATPPPPVPELPPLRPPRNPARSSTLLMNGDDGYGVLPDVVSAAPAAPLQRQASRPKRPSTAASGGGQSTREDVTPWEFSNNGGGSPSTATTREDVTPWEFQPAPQSATTLVDAVEKSLKDNNLSPLAAPSLRSKASSAGLALSTSTGPVEDVTPWELYPVVPPDSNNVSTKSIKSGLGSAYASSLTTPLPQTPLTSLPLTPGSGRKSTLAQTGPLEDVMPWELEPVPDAPIATRTGEEDSGVKSKVKEKEKEKKKEKKEKKESKSKLKSKSLAPIPTMINGGTPNVHGPIFGAGGVGGPFVPPPPLSPSRRSLPYSDHSHSSSHQSLMLVGGNSYFTHGSSNGQPSPIPPLPPPSPHSSHQQQQGRKQPLTGPVEDVLPWEMHPVPAEQQRVRTPTSNNARSRSQSSLGLPFQLPPPPSPSYFPHPLPVHPKSSSGYDMYAGDRRSVASASSRGGGFLTRNRSGSAADSLQSSLGTGAVSRSHSLSKRDSVHSRSSFDPHGEEGDPEDQLEIADLHDFSASLATPSGSGLNGQGHGQSYPNVGILRTRASVSTMATSNSVLSIASLASSFPGPPGNNGFNGSDITNGGAGSSVHSGAAGTIASGMGMGSMSAKQMEDVTPWELFPVPPSVVGGGASAGMVSQGSRGNSTAAVSVGASGAVDDGDGMSKRTSRPSTAASSSSKTRTEFGLRRRRSTGSKAGVAANGTAPGAGPAVAAVREPPVMYGGMAPSKGISNTSISASSPPPPKPAPKLAPKPEQPPTPTPSFHAPAAISAVASSSSTATGVSTASSIRKEKEKAKPIDPRFSTADRTILEELKANIRAREEQFVIKGVGNTVVGGGRCPGKKCHPFPRQEVPYPRSYDREVVDLDVWETMFFLDVCGRLTFHALETPPTKVLEIGCGTGTWLLHCARTWKDCHFVGLDIVPLHPNLQNLGSPDIASRITWVQHNFLDGLPFQNEEFDFVHIKRIALGVPEDKWDALFEEIQRVMKPGAPFEMIEEDLFFPGKRREDHDESPGRDDEASSLTRRNSVSSDRDQTNSNESVPNSPATPTTMNTVLPSISPARTMKEQDVGQRRTSDEHPEAKPATQPSMVLPHSRSSARPKLQIKHPGQPSITSSTVSLLGSMVTTETVSAAVKGSRRTSSIEHPPGPSGSSSPGGVVQPASKTPFSSKDLPKPNNPRDHTILEAIWNGMLESRFVNLSPISILTNYMEWHFKGVRTNPPLLFSFPPVPLKVDDDEADDIVHYESDSDPDEARDAVVPRPKRPQSSKSRKSAGLRPSPLSDEHGQIKEHHRVVSNEAILERQSPYISVDVLRTYASYSYPSPSSQKALLKERSSGLPSLAQTANGSMNIDLRTLNLHLALRAKEVVACSESMWEWVNEYQIANGVPKDKDGPEGTRYRSGSIETALLGVSDAASKATLVNLTKNAILEMSREDFNQLLNNFEMDMQDKACVGNALKQRFDWHIFPSPVLQDRKIFNIACEKYDKWLAAQKSSQTNTHRPSGSLSHCHPGVETNVDHDLIPLVKSLTGPLPSTIHDESSSIATTISPPHRHHDPSSPSTLDHSTPTQHISRALRVFAAWKAPS